MRPCSRCASRTCVAQRGSTRTLGIDKFMTRIVDLELWAAPRVSAILEDGHEVAKACRRATNLADNVVLGLSFVPSEVDVINLAADIDERRLTIAEFESFCRSSGLALDPRNPRSAAHFLAAYAEGAPLAWLHFPEGAEGLQMALAVSNWATDRGYIIRTGQGEPRLSEAAIRAFWRQVDA